MKIQVTFELEDDNEFVDHEHEYGLTTAGYDLLVGQLMALGADDVTPKVCDW